MKESLEGKRILIIGQVWPESRSSAAGKRMLQLLDCFRQWGMDIYFGSTAHKSAYSDDLSMYDVQEVTLWLNDQRSDEVIATLNPQVVMYDRFMMEEQFGWRVTEQCPQAMTILDTEDLHFLRYAREEMIKKGEKDVNPFLYSVRAKRELASIMRCDLSLLISKYEYDLLTHKFKIPASILYYLPFMEERVSRESVEQWLPFDRREGFVFIGNFIHEPNYQTVLKLKKEIWPLLRKKLPKVSMHIYGAYPTQKVLQLHNENERFLIHGRADDALEVIAQAKVMLAPIPFGAGIKGKFIDAIHVGTPSVVSSVGVESMKRDLAWGGFVTDEVSTFVENAIALYTDAALWKEKQLLGVSVLNDQFDQSYYSSDYKNVLTTIFINLQSHRQDNFLCEVFKHQSAQSTKYMGLWIEEKNKS
ncbi:glycosyltransferase [Myroides pelagicus]|uniref:Glycosyltransferase n=1 Tax=Myroides pelagicus TaxID=270914 RepID=A0A7K1GL18_9FLAO|nr:glycosyltransferase [Myroides pelagicus]MEC4112566.1 glycosyltransferase [Myroides pelagicus]MTH29557.1 glycosyltransferase [Myroides pelagicus]